jgi:tyrosyl-tRNA synthetase
MSQSIEDQVALLIRGRVWRSDSAGGGGGLKKIGWHRRARADGCASMPADPTSDLHLSHTIPMPGRQFRADRGHLRRQQLHIGIGDPDQDKLRLSRTSSPTYAEQAYKILERADTRIEYNHTWLGRLTLQDVIPLAANFTLQQFLTRETFRKRWEHDDPVYLHETFYALVQAYDAYHLRADVQIGGTDQLFNILTAGRKLMEALGVPPNIGIIMGILPGTDGVLKMSKSLGNQIPLTTTAEDMYGKVMSVPDAAMPDSSVW